MNVKNLSFPSEIEISNIATSLYKEGYNLSRVDIVREILCELEKKYLEFVKNENKDKIIDMYKQYSVVLGKNIYIVKEQRERIGRMYRYKCRWKFNCQKRKWKDNRNYVRRNIYKRGEGICIIIY